MRYVTFFTFVCVLLTIQFLPAQAPDTLWTRTYGDGVGNCVIETSDSGYVIVGQSSWDRSNLIILKTDSHGDSLWSKTYGDTNFNDYGCSVRQTADDGFIIVGSTTSYGAGEDDVWLIKTNEYGDTLWTKTYGGSGYDIGKCVQITNDGGYIIVGTTESYGAGGQDIWLIKTNSNGQTEWTQTYGGNLTDIGNCVIQTSSNDYLIAGGTSNLTTHPGVWLIKTDASGDTSWTKKYFDNVAECDAYAECIIATNDGFVLCGYIYVNGFGHGCLIKTDFSGDTLWTKTYYYTPGSLWENKISEYIGDFTWSHSLIRTYDDSYLVTNSRLEIYGVFPGNVWKGFFFKVNENGSFLWNKSLCESIASYSGLLSVIQVTDSSYVVTGCQGEKLYLAKISSSVTGLKKSDDIITHTFSLSQNYPNPFNPSTTIDFNLPKTSEVTLKVLNILGEEVATIVSDRLSAGSYSYEWDASTVASGIYLYRLQASDYVETRKMVLMK